MGTYAPRRGGMGVAFVVRPVAVMTCAVIVACGQASGPSGSSSQGGQGSASNASSSQASQGAGDADAANEGAAPACSGPVPAMGTSCSTEQGCLAGTVCAFCAPTTGGIGVSCASGPCGWGSMDLSASPNGPVCPPTPPTKGAMCGNNASCYYCVADGLLSATCASIAETFTWNVTMIHGPNTN